MYACESARLQSWLAGRYCCLSKSVTCEENFSAASPPPSVFRAAHPYSLWPAPWLDRLGQCVPSAQSGCDGSTPCIRHTCLSIISWPGIAKTPSPPSRSQEVSVLFSVDHVTLVLDCSAVRRIRPAFLYGLPTCQSLRLACLADLHPHLHQRVKRRERIAGASFVAVHVHS